MSDSEFEYLLNSIRGIAGQNKHWDPIFVINCLRYENTNLLRLKVLLDTLNKNDKINSLNFKIIDYGGGEDVPEGINAEGAKVIAEFLKTNTTIHSIRLMCNSIGTEGANALAEALKVNKTLQAINLAICSIDDISQMANALKHNSSLKKIALGHNSLGPDDFIQLAEVLKLNNTLTSLDLYDNELDEESLCILAEALKVNDTLQEIDLGRCAIEDITPIATALKNNTGLKKIGLSANLFGSEDIIQLAEVLKTNKTLTTLEYNFNDVDDVGAGILAEGLKSNDTLRTLSIREDTDSKGYLIKKKGGAELFKMMLQEANLSLCKLEYNFEDTWAHQWPYKGVVDDPCSPFLNRNELFANLQDSIISFRESLNEFSTALKTKNISRSVLKKYLDRTHYDNNQKFYTLEKYSFPITLDTLSKEDKKAILISRERWSDTMAQQLYQEKLQEIKALREKYGNTEHPPELKEKMNRKLEEMTESLDLAYYGRDAESLNLPFEIRIAKLEALLKTTKNKAHQEDAKASLLPLYLLLMAREKDEEQRKIYALSSLACGGMFDKTDIAEEYKIEHFEERLKQRKAELKLDDEPQEEKQAEQANEQKVYSNAGKSTLTTFQSEGATTDVSTTPTPTCNKAMPNLFKK